MSPIIAKVARIASPALKLMTLLILAVTAWMGVSVEINTAPSSASEGVIAYSVGGIEKVYADPTPGANWTPAVAAKKEPTTPPGPTAVETAVLAAVNTFIDILFVLFNPILFLAGWLLTPDWVFGEVFGFRPILHQFWVLVSNVVYIIFAFLLVGIAFMNIFGSEQSAWQMKTKLPKLIIGIISVPFTWFFVSAITSTASILTASVIQLPANMITEDGTKAVKIKVPEKCTINFNKAAISQSADKGDTAKDGMFGCTSSQGEGKTFGELFSSKSAYGVLTAYAYGIYKFQDIKLINGLSIQSIKSVADISAGLLMALVFFFVFGLLITALVFALFSRAVMLWIYAIFSPLLSLSYFFEWKLPGGLEDKFGITKIISLAMVPVLVAGALSFGMLFLHMAQSADINPQTSDHVQPATCSPDANGATSTGCTAFSFAETKFEVIGKPVGVAAMGARSVAHFGMTVIGQLMINVLGLIVLWIAVMAALKSNKITEDAVKPVAEFGESIGKLMKSIPKMIPIIPTPHGAMGLWGLSSVGQNFSSEILNSQSRKGAELGTKWWQAFTGSTDRTRLDVTNSLAGIWNVDKNQTGQKLTNALEVIAKNMDYEKFVKNQEVRNEFAVWVESINSSIIPADVTKEIAKKIRTGNEDEMAKALKELEHKLGEGVMGGEGTNFGTSDSTKKWFNSRYTNAKSWTNSNNSSDTGNAEVSKKLDRVSIGIQEKNINFTAPADGNDKPAINITVEIKDKKVTQEQFNKAASETKLDKKQLKDKLTELGINTDDVDPTK